MNFNSSGNDSNNLFLQKEAVSVSEDLDKPEKEPDEGKNGDG